MTTPFPENNGWPYTTSAIGPDYNQVNRFPEWSQLLADKLAAALGGAPPTPGQPARPPMTMARFTGTLSLQPATATAIPWTDITPAGTSPAVTYADNATKLVIAQDGIYRLTSQITVFGNTDPGYLHNRLYINGSLNDFSQLDVPTVATQRTTLPLERLLFLAVNDELTISAYRGSAGSGSTTVDNGLRATRFEIARVSD